MVEKAFIKANIPFTANDISQFNTQIANAENNGWKKSEMQGSFLLKHINTSFGKNGINLSKKCEDLNFTIPSNYGDYKLTVSEVNIFYFDTGTGIISMHIPYLANTNDEELINVCATLRSSVKHENEESCCPIFKNGEKTYLSCIAEEFLASVAGKSAGLFGQFTETSSKRIDMFSAVLFDRRNEEDGNVSSDRVCYLMANAYDNRDKKLDLKEEEFYRQHEYSRWCFTKRGCCAVANITGNDSNDNFLQKRWLLSVMTNYFYLYLMVLHQKYAIYNYLNIVATDSKMSNVVLNQESLIEFNSKYIFSIVSDEHFIQRAYRKMKEVNNVDEVYGDLLDELKRMFDYTRLKSNEVSEERNNKLNLISLVISIICSISIVIDTISLFSSQGIYMGFDTKNNTLCTSVIIGEVLFLVLCILYVFIVNKKKE